MFKHILAPTDGSPLGDSALPLAAELARSCGAALLIVHVLADPENEEEAPPSSGAPLPSRAQVGAQLMLERLVHKLGAPARFRLEYRRRRSVADALLAVAAEEGADVIVMGTHGRSAVMDLLLGSVAEEVLRRAEVPVLFQRLNAAQAARVGGRA